MSGALLLDTHAALWYVQGNSERMPASAQALIDEPGARVWVSAVSLAEVAVKATLGKLRVDPDFPEQLTGAGIELLPLAPQHAWALRDLPLHHRDPFDRMLIAQALAEDLVIVTRDPAFDAYAGLRTTW